MVAVLAGVINLLILSKKLTNEASFCNERLFKDLDDAGFLFLDAG